MNLKVGIGRSFGKFSNGISMMIKKMLIGAYYMQGSLV